MRRASKAGHFREYTTIHNPTLFPGVVEFVNRAGSQYLMNHFHKKSAGIP